MTKSLTVGKPIKLIITFALPMMLGNIFQLFYNLTDSVILGRFVSSDALAAVGVTGPVSSLLIGFAFGLTTGFAIPVSQAFGENNPKKVKKYFGNAVILTFLIAIIITAISLLASKPLLRLINTPENIIDDANLYAIIMYSGTAFLMFYNLFASMLRGLGDSRSPLLFIIISSVLNIIFDLIFVLFFRMSVKGVAIASVLSYLISVCLCVFYIIHCHKELHISKSDIFLEKAAVKELLRMGIPMALQLSITAIGSLMLQGAVNAFGSNAVAAVSIGNRVEQIVNIVLSSLGVALSTFAAQNKGAGNFERVFKATRDTFFLDASLSIGASAILFFFGKRICSLFVSSAAPELLNYSDNYLKTLAFFYIWLSVLFIFRNVLQGLGYGYTSVIAGTSELVGRFLVAYLLSSVLGFTAICIAGPLAWILADIPLLIIYFYNKRKILSNNTKKPLQT